MNTASIYVQFFGQIMPEIFLLGLSLSFFPWVFEILSFFWAEAKKRLWWQFIGQKIPSKVQEMKWHVEGSTNSLNTSRIFLKIIQITCPMVWGVLKKCKEMSSDITAWFALKTSLLLVRTEFSKLRWGDFWHGPFGCHFCRI